MITDLQKLVSEEVLGEYGITKNELALAIGVPNSYFTALLKGKIARPHRDKLVAIASGLQLSQEDAKDLLNAHGYAGLSKNDAELLISVARQRILKGLQVVKDNFYADLAILSAETTPGDQVWVTNDWPMLFCSEDYYLECHERRGMTDPVARHVLKRAFQERTALFGRSIETHETHCLLCRKCVLEYALSPRDDEERGHRKKQFEILISHLHSPNMKVSLLEQCPRLRFLIKKPENGEKPIVLFLGIPPYHQMPGDSWGDRLYGFVTDNEKISTQFIQEYESLKQSALPEYETPRALARYLKEFLAANGYGELNIRVPLTVVADNDPSSAAALEKKPLEGPEMRLAAGVEKPGSQSERVQPGPVHESPAEINPVPDAERFKNKELLEEFTVQGGLFRLYATAAEEVLLEGPVPEAAQMVLFGSRTYGLKPAEGVEDTFLLLGALAADVLDAVDDYLEEPDQTPVVFYTSPEE